jgi:predicted ferric reductase
VGADRLARWHASLGRYTICLVVAHAFLLLTGYALADHVGPLSEAQTLLTGYSGVLLAVIGTALLVGVGVVSARAARTHLSYEVWYHVHLTTYVAVALSFLHQVRNGAQLVASPTARHLWWGLYLGAGVLLLVFRVIVPLHTSMRQQMRVVDVHHEALGVVSIVVAGKAVGDLGAEAGQFFRWRFLTRYGWWGSHPFSLSAPPHGNLLRITVKDLGDHSSSLQRVRPGTRVLVAGPYGAMTAARRTQNKVLLVAGGVGITPLRALFETLPAYPGDLTLVYRASRAEDLVFRAELDAIAARRRAKVHYCVGRRGGPGDPFVGTRLSRLVPRLAEHDVYVCGPPPMTDAVVQVVRAAGVPKRHVHAESFDLVPS